MVRLCRVFLPIHLQGLRRGFGIHSIMATSPLDSDLATLSTLPSSVLARLIDPSAPPEKPPTVNARAELSAFDPSSATVQQSVSASRAYVSEMRSAAEQLEPNVITTQERDIDGERIEKIRAAAEEVKGAIEEYAQKVRMEAK